MADYEIVDVTKLQKAEGVKDGDTLLLIRQQGDGTSICMRTDGAQFNPNRSLGFLCVVRQREIL